VVTPDGREIAMECHYIPSILPLEMIKAPEALEKARARAERITRKCNRKKKENVYFIVTETQIKGYHRRQTVIPAEHYSRQFKIPQFAPPIKPAPRRPASLMTSRDDDIDDCCSVISASSEVVRLRCPPEMVLEMPQLFDRQVFFEHSDR
jgi:hypothetical protein